MNKLSVKITSILVLTSLISFSGCGKKEASVADYESSQMNAKLNAQRNGDSFLQANGMKETAVFDTDTSISRKHLKGDGYASADLMMNGKATGKRIWCGTLRGRGCKLSKPDQDGRVDSKLDHSTPIVK